MSGNITLFYAYTNKKINIKLFFVIGKKYINKL